MSEYLDIDKFSRYECHPCTVDPTDGSVHICAEGEYINFWTVYGVVAGGPEVTAIVDTVSEYDARLVASVFNDYLVAQTGAGIIDDHAQHF